MSDWTQLQPCHGKGSPCPCRLMLKQRQFRPERGRSSRITVPREAASDPSAARHRSSSRLPPLSTNVISRIRSRGIQHCKWLRFQCVHAVAGRPARLRLVCDAERQRRPLKWRCGRTRRKRANGGGLASFGICKRVDVSRDQVDQRGAHAHAELTFESKRTVSIRCSVCDGMLVGEPFLTLKLEAGARSCSLACL